MKISARSISKSISLAVLLTVGLPTIGLAAVTDYFVRASASNVVITFPGSGPETNSSSNNLSTITATSSAGPASSLPLNSSSAIASLESASIRGAVSVSSIENKQADGKFSGDIRDHLTFDLPDGMDTAVITAVFDIKGALSASQDLSSGGLLLQSWDISGDLTFGSAHEGGNLYSQPDFDPLFTHQLTAQWQVSDGVPVYIAAGFNVTLRAIAGAMLFDFNSADANQISLIMPEGTTFESASGAFLTAVPLPASVWLLGAALCGLFRWAGSPRVSS